MPAIQSAGPTAEEQRTAEALIREARRRQRRRRLVTSLTGLVVLAVAAGALQAARGTGHGPALPGHPRTARSDRAKSGGATRSTPDPIPASVGSTVVMWLPSGVDANGVYVADLANGETSYPVQPLLGSTFEQGYIDVGDWLVYGDQNGNVDAIPASLTGSPRVLGSYLFAPAAGADQVWVMSLNDQRARLVSVPSGRSGPAISLPAGATLLAGTDGGLLLQKDVLELWRPGQRARVLPYWSGSATEFGVSPRFVAYGTACRSQDLPGNTYYNACATLRVLDVATGHVSSFPAPPGTAGWVPGRGYNDDNTISAGAPMIAAQAALAPLNRDQAVTYVLRLGRGRAKPVAVPYSTGPVLSLTSWSVRGSWLFYQGPGQQLWGYQVTTGKVRASSDSCCHYTFMVSVPS
jgi:hypothetical protein